MSAIANGIQCAQCRDLSVTPIDQDRARRLKSARKDAGNYRHASDAARYLQIPTDTYRSYENGNRNIPAEVAVSAGRAFGVTAGYIMFGEGIKSPSQIRHIRPTIASLKLPMVKLSDLRGASMDNIEQIINKSEKTVEVTAVADLSRFAYTIEVEDDSMIPFPPEPGDNFPRGQQLAFDPKQPINPGDYIIASFKGEEALFRKYREVSTDDKGRKTVELVPLNSNYRTVRGVLDESIFLIARLEIGVRKY